MAGDPLLEVTDLAVGFPTRGGLVRAVRGVSFRVRQGEILAIVGESGSGKSATGLSMLRLLPPSAQVVGSIELVRKSGARADLLRLSDRAMRGVRGNDIAMIFQEPMSSLDPIYTIGTQLCEAIQAHDRMARGAAERLAIDALAAVGLADPKKCMRSYPHLLSGGMRQRVMIAMALAGRPSLLIADEPTTALDVTIQAQIVDHLKELQRRTGMAIIFITHNLGLVAEIADRALVMYAGEIVEAGTIDALFATPLMPYTQGLLNSMPRLGMKRDAANAITPIPGSFPSVLDLPPGCTFHPRCGHFVRGLCDVRPPALESHERARQVRCARWRELSKVLR